MLLQCKSSYMEGSVVIRGAVHAFHALQFPSGRGTRRSGFLRFVRRTAHVADVIVAAIVEARQNATSYHELARLSDASLHKRGLTRETLARFAVLGRTN
jgi:hypothetical protein